MADELSFALVDVLVEVTVAPDDWLKLNITLALFRPISDGQLTGNALRNALDNAAIQTGTSVGIGVNTSGVANFSTNATTTTRNRTSFDSVDAWNTTVEGGLNGTSGEWNATVGNVTSNGNSSQYADYDDDEWQVSGLLLVMLRWRVRLVACRAVFGTRTV